MGFYFSYFVFLDSLLVFRVVLISKTMKYVAKFSSLIILIFMMKMTRAIIYRGEFVEIVREGYQR